MRKKLTEHRIDWTRQGTTIAKSVRAFYLTLVMVLALAPPARAQIGAYPVTMSFDRDAPTTRVLTVLSEATEPMLVRLYLGDFEQYAEGGHDWGPLGAHPMSCDGRIAVFPESVELDPGTSAKVRVTMEPGAETCWSAVFVERVVPEAAYRVAHRIAVKVYGHPDEAVTNANVVAVDVELAEVGLEAVITMDNVGNTNLQPEGELEIRSNMGDVVHSQEIPLFSVLPGHRRIVRVPLPTHLPAGSFLAIPIFDIGQDYLLGGQASFQVAGEGER